MTGAYMIHQLKEDEYRNVRSLYSKLRFNLVVDSIVDGNTPAWVFVDHKKMPRTAALWNKQDALLLAGDVENEEFNLAFGEQLIQKIIPDARQRYIPEISFYCDSNVWESRLGSLLKVRSAEKVSRRYYVFAGLRTDWRKQIPFGAEIRRIDEALLGNDGLGNIEQVVGWVRSFWHSNQDFIRTGFGYCLLKEEVVASWCLSVYVSGMDYELCVATVPEYRRQGLATLTASACVGYCEENGLRPHWHCWNDNVGSIAVAEKIGFEKPTTYYVYRVNLG
jgi:RimJ/RimL family protein N-acetyltransferase